MGHLLLTAAACDGSAPLVSSVPTPALYFILQVRSTDAAVGDAFALVATTALPYDARYLSVESAEAYRVADGRSLAIEVVPRNGPVAVQEFGTVPTYSTGTGNLRWRAQGGGGLLGVRDILPGDSLVFRVVAEGSVLNGALRVPLRPEPVITIENGDRFSRWRSDAGTALWTAQTGRGGRVLNDTVLNIDTAFTPFALETADSLYMTAYDANASAFILAPYGNQAGVSGGLGVVGAVVSSRPIVLPPR